MAQRIQSPPQPVIASLQPDKLTRQQLRDLEAKEKTPLEQALERIILCLPVICGGAAILEYLLIPDNTINRNPYTYPVVLILFILMYVLYGSYAAFKRQRGESGYFQLYAMARNALCRYGYPL